MLAVIAGARSSIRLEVYTFAPGTLGERFRDALVDAQKRGAQVQVLIDAFGSMSLPGDFWQPLQTIGGEVRWFNPVAMMRFTFRDHRKMLVCDEQIAVVGGFNIGPEYEGDGVKSGWRDLGIRLEGPLAAQLAFSFDGMFGRADLAHKRLPLRWRRVRQKSGVGPAEQIFSSEPGRGRNLIRVALRADMIRARDMRIIMAYFLPGWRMRRDMAGIVQRGGRVQLILAGKSDVLMSQLAAQSLYRRLMNEGVEIYEYQPQILHAKLIVVDDVVYVGSSNLDPRSMRINYELMIRFEDRQMAGEARGIFAGDLEHCHRIDAEEWRKSHTLWQRAQRRAAYWFLARFDPGLARRQWRGLPD
jgi:cardiolipin synthase